MSDIIYKGQTFLIELDTELTDDLTQATKTQILYTKPNGIRGAWDAIVSGQSLTKKVLASENDDWGTWRVQVYLEFGSDVSKGKIVEIRIFDSLKVS